MHELVTIQYSDCVIELIGGGAPTRYIFMGVRGIPPGGDNWTWIEQFDQCSTEEAQRLDRAGRQATVYNTGTLLMVDGKPIQLFHQPPTPAQVEAALANRNG